MKISILVCLGCALVAVGQCQELTSLMFQAMGIEPPLMPPVMPQSLREHLYPRQRRQWLQEQQRLNEQKQRYLTYLASQQQRQVKANNPYSVSLQPGNQPRDNSVYSSANKIRYPGSPNYVGYSKGNPYSSAQSASNRNSGQSSRSYSNPYSVSRGSSSDLPAVRNSAPPISMAPVPVAPQALRLMRSMQQFRQMREHPVRVTDAKSAGCTMPSDSTAAAMLMYSNCRDPAARMICQTEMMTCTNVGMSAMCCPYGINNFALDTIGYVNKLQHFVSELV